jgi:predicted aminopeptidase
VLQGLHRDLDALFRDPARGEAEKAREKARLYASLPARVEAAGFAEPERYRAAAARGLNNAALYEFATYNDPRTPVFQALLDREGGDLLAFMRAVQRHTRGQRRDPFGALQAAVGAAPVVQIP